MPRPLAAAALAALFAAAPFAQRQPLTLDDIYGPQARLLSGSASSALRWIDDPWLDDGHFLWPDENPDGAGWLRVDAVSGAREPLAEPSAVAASLAQLGVGSGPAESAARRRPAIFNPRRTAFLVIVDNDLFCYRLDEGVAVRLTSDGAPKEEATFSPDGRLVAFVSGNDLYVVTVDEPQPRRLTAEGGPDLLNGKLDWVYSEELYGRGRHRAYWWSPDSTRLAFLQIDDSSVPQYPLLDLLATHPAVEPLRYPKAGDVNPAARLGLAAVDGRTAVRWLTERASDVLIVNAGWAPDGRLAYQLQDRRQTRLELRTADPASGSSTTLFTESGPPWVERWDDASADPVWLSDGSFLWLSERSGWRHIYRYSRSGGLLGQLTTGDWEVRQIDGVDEKRGSIYFSATERSVLGLDSYRIELDGSGMRRLSDRPGTHQAFFNPSTTLFLDSWSDAATPPQVSLHRSSGDRVRTVESNPVPALDTYALSKPEFLQVKARDGFLMEAMLIRPPDFDPGKRYPVYQYAYGGPHRQTVVNGWRRSEYLFEQLLAQRGILIWLCDNRTASGKGAVSVWPVHGRFGETELRDLDDCAGWLAGQPYVDSSRMALAGYSFGGFLTAYAMTHPSRFSAGIAGGALTDWRDYDSIYTERYMGTPQDDPGAYRRSSPRFAAADLHGRLLLTHDLGDDNVHAQNTLQFAYELQKAGKSFQMMLYPAAGHGLTAPALVLHERRLMLDFVLQALRP